MSEYLDISLEAEVLVDHLDDLSGLLRRSYQEWVRHKTQVDSFAKSLKSLNEVHNRIMQDWQKSRTIHLGNIAAYMKESQAVGKLKVELESMLRVQRMLDALSRPWWQQLRAGTETIVGAANGVRSLVAQYAGLNLTQQGIIKTVIDFKQAQFDATRISRLFGESIGDLNRTLADVKATTAMSQQGFVALNFAFKQMYIGVPPASRVIKEFAANALKMVGSEERVAEISRRLMGALGTMPNLMDRIMSAQKAYNVSMEAGNKAVDELTYTMRSYGLSQQLIDDAISATRGDMGPAQKALLDYQLRMQEVDKRNKDAALTISQNLMPLMVKFAEITSTLAQGLSKLPPFLQETLAMTIALGPPLVMVTKSFESLMALTGGRLILGGLGVGGGAAGTVRAAGAVAPAVGAGALLRGGATVAPAAATAAATTGAAALSRGGMLLKGGGRLAVVALLATAIYSFFKRASDESKKAKEEQEKIEKSLKATANAESEVASKAQTAQRAMEEQKLMAEKFQAAIKTALSGLPATVQQFAKEGVLAEGLEMPLRLNMTLLEQNVVQATEVVRTKLATAAETMPSLFGGMDAKQVGYAGAMQAIEKIGQEVTRLGEAIRTAGGDAPEKMRSDYQTLLQVFQELSPALGVMKTSIKEQAGGIMDSLLSKTDAYLEQTKQSVEMAKLRMDLAESTNLGMAKSYQATKDTVMLQQQQINLLQQRKADADRFVQMQADQMGYQIDWNLALQDSTAFAQDLYDTAKKRGATEDQAADIQMRVLVGLNKRREIEKELLGVQRDQVQLTKQFREGYLDAMAEAMTAAGDFSEIIGTQKRGVTQLLTLGAAPTLRYGGMGRLTPEQVQGVATQRGARFTTQMGEIAGGIGNFPLMKYTGAGGPEDFTFATAAGRASSMARRMGRGQPGTAYVPRGGAGEAWVDLQQEAKGRGGNDFTLTPQNALGWGEALQATARYDQFGSNKQRWGAGGFGLMPQGGSMMEVPTAQYDLLEGFQSGTSTMFKAGSSLLESSKHIDSAADKIGATGMASGGVVPGGSSVVPTSVSNNPVAHAMLMALGGQVVPGVGSSDSVIRRMASGGLLALTPGEIIMPQRFQHGGKVAQPAPMGEIIPQGDKRWGKVKGVMDNVGNWVVLTSKPSENNPYRGGEILRGPSTKNAEGVVIGSDPNWGKVPGLLLSNGDWKVSSNPYLDKTDKTYISGVVALKSAQADLEAMEQQAIEAGKAQGLDRNKSLDVVAKNARYLSLFQQVQKWRGDKEKWEKSHYTDRGLNPPGKEWTERKVKEEETRIAEETAHPRGYGVHIFADPKRGVEDKWSHYEKPKRPDRMKHFDAEMRASMFTAQQDEIYKKAWERIQADQKKKQEPLRSMEEKLKDPRVVERLKKIDEAREKYDPRGKGAGWDWQAKLGYGVIGSPGRYISEYGSVALRTGLGTKGGINQLDEEDIAFAKAELDKMSPDEKLRYQILGTTLPLLESLAEMKLLKVVGSTGKSAFNFVSQDVRAGTKLLNEAKALRTAGTGLGKIPLEEAGHTMLKTPKWEQTANKTLDRYMLKKAAMEAGKKEFPTALASEKKVVQQAGRAKYEELMRSKAMTAKRAAGGPLHGGDYVVRKGGDTETALALGGELVTGGIPGVDSVPYRMMSRGGIAMTMPGEVILRGTAAVAGPVLNKAVGGPMDGVDKFLSRVSSASSAGNSVEVRLKMASGLESLFAQDNSGKIPTVRT